MRAFWWDEVEAAVHDVEVQVPDGSSARQALLLADDAIAQLSGEEWSHTEFKQIRHEGDVFVLDGLFNGRHVSRCYICFEGDDDQCRALASKELFEYVVI
jgi:hypothetical protein